MKTLGRPLNMAEMIQEIDGGITSWAKHAEFRMLIRWASGDLNDTERLAICATLTDTSDEDAAEVAGVGRAAIWMARQCAMRKMRHRLEALGIHSAEEVLS